MMHTSYALGMHVIFLFFLHAAVFQYLLWKEVVVLNSYAGNKIHIHTMNLLDKLDKAFNLSDV